MRQIIKWIMRLIGLMIFPISLIFSFYITYLVRKTTKKPNTDFYKQEQDEYVKLKIDLNKNANRKRAEEFDISTDFGMTRVIRWNKTNKKKVVLFVHGILSDRYTSAKAQEFYSHLGYDVISFDGYGWGTTAEYGTRSKFAQKEQIELLNRVIKNVKEKYKLDNLVIHGESMGGATVYKYIETYGTDNFSKVIIDAGFTNFYENFKYIAFKQISWPLYYFAQTSLWLPFSLIGYPTTSQIKRDTIRKIKVPLLHLHSVKDESVMFVHHIDWRKAYVNNSKSYIYKNTNVRHVRGYYDAPEEIKEQINNFLN